ncbi:ring-1,2-phenylacetyl-CoA epoxidase subunit PaaC [Scopulibacillus darangshiensis]|uniref:Ring-1,2-phenylacetyl-CoA epoxidase subunit PaaC n=1 Tax=Scopulibacillus darangshiensis TaxID=442528 RepID=A0A4R2P3I1_9BACL|nr:1,2-phenylacetyl-CoA epoxidase subunit PaaC [Scopulibacillus darangshiensis]TCP29253.1 ring-1,2-phenylacetyl-CoA epoxidase subunit PaaC [Scopulibacillus darangshiensis]
MSIESNKQELTELIYQLADDDFIHAHRGSEWLGLAPHIEEDVAFSSINQDTMGHATMYYRILSELGEGKADDLSHLRKKEQFRNAIILEEKNGTGEYLDSPNYDWAFTVIRHLFYDVAKKIRLESLKQSSYEPLADAARKMLTEQYYHLLHWKIWFKQLMTSTEEARDRMETAIKRVWKDFGGVLTLGPHAEKMVSAGLIEDEAALRERFIDQIQELFNEVNYSIDNEPLMIRGDGRNGEHTEDLEHALKTLSEVYVSDPQATGW